MRRTSQALMVQGTTSDAGKSVLVAGLCRVLARCAVKVAPFKSQNMALNSGVTDDGGEIGRAQVVQAQAARVQPTVDMNPVLIKPNSDIGAQIIIQGKAFANMDAVDFHGYKKIAMPYVMESFDRLSEQFDTVIIEGAGSPAEINLRENDIANMGFAEKADIPVIIVADIDRGGVFAHLYGTLALLSKSEQNRVIGFVINRFRGDISLLESGLDWLEEKTGKPVLGVIPYLHGLNIEAEDAIAGEQIKNEQTKITIAVPVLTRISNHTDFDALRLHPDVDFRYVGKGESLGSADLIILPGSKSVRDDLAYLREQGWDNEIYRHLRYGGKVMGICGGYQMLGQSIDDSLGIEGAAGKTVGLGLLNVETVLAETKQLKNVIGTIELAGKLQPVQGYEIHAGVTHVNEHQPITRADHVGEGALNQDSSILGTYWHGVFDSPDFVELLTSWVNGEQLSHFSIVDEKEKAIDRIADALESHMDLNKLWPDMRLERQ
ncbi:cobyric acid synthase CobQ [Vibrio sp. 10N.286.49.C2]|uniref:cobyric acid synthase n=1 Tax=unclassified Vibrio TaxID=2614977 RepID=UPI000C83E8C3|nr:MULTISPECIES: cobyric acid synthase [unclassified Vibrio]PMH38288.1 cobyric acid synthase CobQ [Vibrio sp. 10N.286.49.C2]PMH55696.1 cobyric acid synthase CobQ [Vibrio sp. 10N.286.49.B1]PMH79274.1 cobyric acid synthase CobQ [Vibrio sp. 10N.286.48.B7]